MPECVSRNKIHIDDVIAEIGFIPAIATIGSIILAVFLTIIFWDLGFVSTLSFAIPILTGSSVFKAQHNKIAAFNLMYYNSKRMREK